MKTLRALALFFAASVGAFAQGAMLPNAQQFFDANGYPLAGGFVFTCVAGSSCGTIPVTNALASYTDATLGTANPNPVVLDASGSAAIWGGGSAYKIVIQNSLGVVLHIYDQVTMAGIALGAQKCIANGIACLDSLGHVPAAELPIGLASGVAGLDSSLFVPQANLNYWQGGTGAVNESIQFKFQQSVSVKDFGAKGDAATDDTASINAAFAASHNVYFPDGTYMLTCDGPTNAQNTYGGVAPLSNTVIAFSGAAILKCKANASGYYAALRLFNTTNIWIYGGTIDGNRSAVTASAGTQWGMALTCNGCSNVWINGTILQNGWGDGMIIDKTFSTGTYPTNVNLDHVLSTNNRRNGLSVVNSTGTITILASKFQGSNGTSPQAGVDVEPGGSANSVGIVKFIGSDFTGNSGRGLSVVVGAGSGTVSSVQVLGGLSDSNTFAGFSGFGSGLGNMTISGATASNNGNCGIFIQTVPDGGANIVGNYVIGNGNAASTPDCPNNIQIQTAVGVKLTGNTIRKGANAILPAYGLNLNSNTTSQVIANDLAGSGGTGDFNSFSETTPYLCGNRLTAGMQACTGVQPSVLSGTTVALTGGSITAGTCQSAAATISGVTAAMAAAYTSQAYLGGAVSTYATASTNTITVWACATAAVTLTAAQFNVRVIQ